MSGKIAAIRAQMSHNKLSIKAAKGENPTDAEIILYADIGGGGWFSEGVSAKQFSDELSKLPASINKINLRLNSPGGDVFDGMTIYNRLRQHKAKVTVYVDGLAASIASIIALAGDEVIMGEGSMLMIHKPWSWAMGNADDMEARAETLDNIEEQMLSIYSKKSSLSKEELRDKLRKETWIDADNAIEWGFATSKAEDQTPIAASALKREWIKTAPQNSVRAENILRGEAAAMKAKIDALLIKK